MKNVIKNATLVLALLVGITFTSSASTDGNETKKVSQAELLAAEMPTLEALFLSNGNTIDSAGVIIFNENFEVIFENHFVTGQESKEVKEMIENYDLILIENGISYYQRK